MRLLLALILMLPALSAQAVGSLYGELRVGASGVRHSNLDFYPALASINAGIFIKRKIGIEAFVDAPLTEDSNGAFKTGLSRASGIGVRLQSPPRLGTEAYLSFGYVAFSIEQFENDERGQRTVKQNFDGASVRIGIQKRLQVAKQLKVGLEYRNFYSDSGVTVDGLSLGLHAEFQ